MSRIVDPKDEPEMRAVLRSQELTDEKNRKMAARLRRERDAAQAQAADLLAALEETFPTDNPGDQMTGADVTLRARAAIAKAKGEA